MNTNQEEILFESTLVENNAPETIQPGTGQTDIAQQTPKARLARNVLTQSLPFMVGFVQPLLTPTGFIFGFQDRKNTGITHPDFPVSRKGTPTDTDGVYSEFTTRDPADPMTDNNEQDGLNGRVPAVQATPTPPSDEDAVIIRRLIETQTREVSFDMTNEVIQDINTLFGNDFPDLLQKFINEGGELYGFGSNPDTFTILESFFLPQLMNKATTKINTDFLNYLDTVATNLGTVTIDTLDKMSVIFTAIGEMREALAENTNKSGSVFIVCTPRIANYIAGTLGMTSSNGGFFLEKGKPNQNPHLNGFVGQFGDVKVYQYRGVRPDTEESIIMGFDGENGPNTASIYYTPFKEYIIQGGDDYMTGQSTVFYRVRDAWDVNPLDTFDGAQTSPIDVPTGTAKYLVKANFSIAEKAIN